MTSSTFVNDARVMSKGQVTIPKNVREALGIETGDRVTFIVEGSSVRVVNSAIYALMQFQDQMNMFFGTEWTRLTGINTNLQ